MAPPHAPGFLSAADLALLRSTAPPAPSPPWEPPAAPPEREPLDARRVLAALRGKPAAHALVRLRLAADTWGRLTMRPALVFPVLAVPLLVVPWVFGAQFGTGEKAVATVALALNIGLTWYLAVRFELGRRLITRGGDLSGAGDLALIVRYLERASAVQTGRNKDSSVLGHSAEEPRNLEEGGGLRGTFPGTRSLLEHRDADPLCPCPAKNCAGDLATRPLWSSLARNLLQIVFHSIAIMNFLMFFTPLVTLGSDTWTNAWSAILAALYIFNNVMCFWIPYSGLTYGIFAPRAAALESRLQVRVASLAMSDLVVGLRDLVNNTSPFVQVPADEPDLPYIALHHLLAPSWQRRFDNHRLAQNNFAFGLAFGLAYAFIYAAGSSCIPAWVLTHILVHCFYLLDGLLTVARFNSGLSSVQDLYSLARDEIRRLRARCPTGPAADALEAHDAVLSGFMPADGKRATYILDVRVDYGVVRVFAVTVLTVFAVLWGVLRGVGVGVTLESVCPGGGAGS